jgi:hypothetical protein
MDDVHSGLERINIQVFWNMTVSLGEKQSQCVISGFHRVVAENCALLGYYHYSLHNNPE